MESLRTEVYPSYEFSRGKRLGRHGWYIVCSTNVCCWGRADVVGRGKRSNNSADGPAGSSTDGGRLRRLIHAVRDRSTLYRRPLQRHPSHR